MQKGAKLHGLTEKEWFDLRQRRKALDGFQCILCGYRGSDGHGKHLQTDHVVPWSMSHDNSMSNLRTLCFRHHSMLGYRRTVNPFHILDVLTFAEEDAVDRDLNRAFGVLRG